jgi:hypothetical protein
MFWRNVGRPECAAFGPLSLASNYGDIGLYRCRLEFTPGLRIDMLLNQESRER